MSPRPPVGRISWLDPLWGLVELRVNVTAKSPYGYDNRRSEYAHYLNDVERAKRYGGRYERQLQQRWGNRSMRDLNGQLWTYETDVDVIRRMEAEVTPLERRVYQQDVMGYSRA